MNEHNSSSPDVDVEVVATGCGTSCATGCLTVLLITIFVMLVGAPAATRSLGFITLLGFFLNVASHVAVGYFTARAARWKNLPVNLHIFIVGGLVMVFSIASSLFQLRNPDTGQKVAIGILSSLLVIPLMLWGASLYSKDSEAQ
jgi:hypothetical protein